MTTLDTELSDLFAFPASASLPSTPTFVADECDVSGVFDAACADISLEDSTLGNGIEIVPASPTVKLFVQKEIEHRYIIHRDKLEDLDGTDGRLLTIDYYRGSKFPQLFEELRNILGLDISHLLPEFTSARIKHDQSLDGGDDRFSVDLKGPKALTEFGRLDRDELIIPLEDLTDYRRLLPLATKGCLVKERHPKHGYLESDDGTRIPVKAEIDIYRAAGGMDATAIRAALPFPIASVDVEVPNIKLVKLLRDGRHTFEFLQNASLLLTTAEKQVREALSTSRLARKGFDAKACDALNRIAPSLLIAA